MFAFGRFMFDEPGASLEGEAGAFRASRASDGAPWSIGSSTAAAESSESSIGGASVSSGSS